MNKKKLDEVSKVKLIYSGELAIFSIIFLVLGMLVFTRVIYLKETHLNIFNWITIFGGSWLIADCVWTIVSSKRRNNVSLFDKLTTLPLGIYLIIFDLISFINKPNYYEFRLVGMGVVFYYVGVIYLAQAIYHWYKPIPGLFDETDFNKELQSQIDEAIKELNNHKVIAFPTETVMGLGVLYNDFEAYNLLNKIKQRKEDKPYSMMLGDPSLIKKYAYTNANINKIIKKYMPGSLTLLLKAKENVPGYVTHDTGVIGIRVPSNKEALALLNKVNVPLLVPSANKSGESPALNDEEVKKIFKDEIKVVIQGSSVSNKASTIINCVDVNNITLVREGPIPFDEIKELIK